MLDVFSKCYNLQYINISNYIGKNTSDDDFLLKDVSENITYCFNSGNEISELLEQLKNKKCSINYCSNDWRTKKRKIIKEKDLCVFDCSIDNQYKYEFRKECYQDCPEGTYLSIENNKCVIICEEAQPFEINENCVPNCSTQDFFNNICTINNQNINVKENMVNRISNEITDGSLDELLSKVNKDKKDYFVKNNNTEIFHLTSTYNQKNYDYNNVSTIDIGECEEILKEKYGININETLMIFKVDFYIENYMIPITEYEIFNPKTNEKLDLNYCNETKIKIYTPILIEEEYLYKYDPNSNYYKNKCYPNLSECVSDDILSERKNEFNKNYLSLCESNCIFNEYNKKTKIVFCECSFKNEFMKLSEILIKKNELLYYNFQLETDLNSFWDNISFTNNINSESNIIIINSDQLKECLFKENNTKECEESITYEDLINQNYIPLNSKNSIDKVFELFQEHLKNKSININKNEVIVGEDVIFHLTTTEQNEQNNKVSHIDLGECEKILQNIYKIEDPLIIFMVDIIINDTNSTQVEYQVFNPNNLEKLNLSLCENTKINIYSPIKMDYEVYILAKYVKEQGYDIFDSSGDFYNDICSTFTSCNNTDVILNDRRKDFYNKNITLCEDNCQYENFDIEESKVKCLCNIKTIVNSDSSKVKFSPNRIIENFYKIEKYSNFKIVICYRQVFNLSKLKKNYGSYFMITIGLLFLITMIFISIQLKRKINDILRVAFKEFLSLNKKLNKIEAIQKNKEKDDITSKKLLKLKKNNLNPILKKHKKSKYKNEKNNILNSNIKQINELIISPNKKIENKININKKSKIKKLYKKSKSNNDENSNQLIYIKNDNNTINEKVISKNLSNKSSKKSKNKNVNEVLLFSNKNNYNNYLVDKKGNATKDEKIKFNDKIIDLVSKDKRYKYFVDDELNSLDYEYAIEIDTRSFLQIYTSLLKQNHLIIFTFFVKNDYNIFSLKFGLFLINFSLFLFMNAFFFEDDSFHKIYEDQGKYDFLYQIPQILYNNKSMA